jgi:hypothetical protein
MTPSTLSFSPFLILAWAAILLKCVAVTWAIRHWQMPLHPGWLVGPTLIFAVLATVLWLRHRR